MSGRAIWKKVPGKSTHRARLLLASLGVLALVGAALLALGQRDLTDPARLAGPPAEAARLLVERVRYGPGDPAVLEDLLRSQPDRAPAVFAEAVRLAPTWATFRYAQGLVHLDRGEFERAERCFETARRLAPAHSGLAERIGAVWVREARERGDPGLLLDSFLAFRAAAELNPASLRRTWRQLAPFLDDVTALAPIVPEGAAARGVYGTLLLEAGRDAEAVPELETAVAGRHRPDPELETALGRARLGTGDAEGAREAFRTAVAASPAPADLLRALYDDFAAAGRSEVGLALWKDLATEYPRGGRFNLGRHWFERGEGSYRESYAEFEAVWRHGADPATAGYLARIEIAWRRFRDAEIRLRRVLLRAPRDADLHYLLALALRGEGRNEEAVRELERAREIYPTNDLYPRLLGEWGRR